MIAGSMRINKYIVPLSIEAAAYQKMYGGQAQHVVALDVEGCTIQFPAASLRSFVTHEGIQGVFVIRVDENNRLVDIQRQRG
ncbi:MAG: hypothetical protein BMS9Abin08_1567 [Gammaproteobacteria bacterium]|nr:MAG: hypothetical protein BMS9Abin08_1567 [Gammaproteobacteria bacterium]